MALESEINRIVFVGNGSAVTGYPITFPFLDVAHVKVGVQDEEGNIVDLDEDAYVVTSSPSEFKTVEAVADTVNLVAYRQVPLTQPHVFPLAGALSPAQFEQALDRLTMIAQQLARAVDGNGVYVSGEGDGALRDTYVWADATERGTIKPRRRGQLGVQLDDESIWRSDSASVGDWILAAIGTAGATGAQGIQGIQGVQGPAMVFKGTYDAGDEYVAGEVVTRLGSAWIALRTTTGDAPESSASDWHQFADGGNDGWTPVLAVVADGARYVQQVVDWTGGEGTKPAVDKYVGAAGLVTLIADGVNIRGATGATGADGLPGINGINGSNGADGLPGADGMDGASGMDGLPGVDGLPGDDGLPGSMGLPGNDGADGLPGADGATGDDGLPGSMGLPGNDGADGLPGADGATGAPGPKESKVKTPLGSYSFACTEGTRPLFIHVRRIDEALPEKYLAAIGTSVLRFPSGDGLHELCVGIRAEFPAWIMPACTEEERIRSQAFWAQEHIEGGAK